MAVAVLFTTSCAKEDISSSIANGETVEVTFTANLPELGTRAYGDGTKVDILYYNVYEAGTENKLAALSSFTEQIVDDKFTFQLQMIKGMTYDIVLWAQKKDCGYYSELVGKTVTVSYDGKNANDDNRDAFYNFVKNFDPTAPSQVIPLTRPFAQLNAATNDIQIVTNSGVTLTTSTVTVDTYTGFNIATGEVEGEKSTVTFAATDIPTEDLVGKENYTYLSMNYILVPQAGMVTNTTFEFKGTKSSGAEITFHGTSYSNVPLKQNFRTNILGALLTKSTDFNVEIVPDFSEPDSDVVMTATELQDMINSAPNNEPTEIVLGGNINLNDLLASLSSTRAAASAGLTIPEGKEIILDLNGYTLSQTVECTAHYAMICNEGTLTVINGTISFDDNGSGDANFEWGSYTIVNHGTLVIEEGAVIENLCNLNSAQSVVHMYCAIQQAAGTTTVNGGKISTPTYRSVRVNNGTITFNGGVFEGQVWMQPFSDNTAITINDGNFAPRGADGSSVYVENSSKAVGLTINGGYFATKIGAANDIENAIYGGSFGADPATFKAKVAADRIVVKTSNIWSVLEEVSAADEAAFIAAVANGGQITLENNITLSKTLVIEKPVVILLNGKTISANLHKNDGAVIKNTSVLTIKNGTISSLAENGGSALENAGTAVVEGVTLNGAVNANGSWPSYTVNNTGILELNNSTVTSHHGAVASYNQGAVVTLNNTNIDMTGIPGFTSHGIYTYNNGAAVVNGGMIQNKATDQGSTGGSVINGAITVNSGTFSGRIENYYGNPVLNGGTFSVEPKKSFIGEGCKLVNNQNGTWTVVGTITTEAGLKSALAAGGEIVLGADIALSETAVIAEGATVVLDLNGKTLAHSDAENKYAINNLGTLTIKGNGTVTARGIYNGYGNGGDNVASAKLIVENGTFNALGKNGGACIFNYGIAEINGGEFTSIGGYSLNNQIGAAMTIADGVTANNGIYCSGADLTINGGTVEGNRSGCHVVYAWNAKVTINGGAFHNNNSGNSTIMAAGSTEMAIYDGTFSINDGRVPGNGNTWTSCLTDTANNATLTVYNGTFNGGFRVQAGTTMTINGGSFNDCYGSNYNIYGTAVVKGGTYTDDAAKAFAEKYVAEGYEINENGKVVAE